MTTQQLVPGNPEMAFATDGQHVASHPMAVLQPPTPYQIRLVAGGALLCGIAGDLLLRETAEGVGLAAYLLAILATMLGIVKARVRPKHAGDIPAVQSRLLIAVGAVFATLLMLRSEEIIAFANVVTVLGAVGLSVALLPGSGLNLFALRVRDLAYAGIESWFNAAIGAMLFAFRHATKLFRSGNASTLDSRLAGAIGRAVLLGGVLTLSFGLLLSAGDPVFRHVMTPLVDWNAPELMRHLATIGFLSWPVLGLLAAVHRRLPAAGPQSIGSRIERFIAPSTPSASPTLSLNRLDALVALGAMNSLFALFMLLQFRVLFGGQAYVTATTGLTLAEYARGGFFTLTFTAALVIGLLLAIDALLRTGSLAGWRVSRVMSSSLLGLVGVMLASAAGRMFMYVGTFGISVDRIVALAIMAWLASVAVWFTVTVLRGRPARFVVGSLSFGAATLLLVNATNIDAIVVNSGLARVADGRPFDVQYMTRTLSADAVPTLVRAVIDGRIDASAVVAEQALTRGSYASGAACTTAALLLQRWGTATETRASAWTFGAWRARRAVAANAAALRARACPIGEVA
ncbi:MAG: DUF4173 domain-containing protein, partial [Gemmatimonas sp.]